jgi:hypothetical protein
MDQKALDRLHFEGRIWMIGAFFLFVSVPFIFSAVTGIWPKLDEFLPGFLTTAMIFWPVAVIEVLTFSPMLGVGGTYLGFVTGNLTNMKVPAALNAQDALGLDKGSEAADAIATIAIATSSIVTMLIIIIGIILFIPLTPFLNSEALKPAFDNVIPALFGALGMVYIAKRPTIAMIPLAFMVIFFLIVRDGSIVGIMVPVGVILALSTARYLYKKGMIQK